MARLIVGISGHSDDNDALLTLNVGADNTIELFPEGAQGEGVRWYWSEVDDADMDTIIAALFAKPNIAAVYRQPLEGPPI